MFLNVAVEAFMVTVFMLNRLWIFIIYISYLF